MAPAGMTCTSNARPSIPCPRSGPAAIAIIDDAARRGTLKPGPTVVEATSGNTGIALAMVCAVKGYPFVAIMSDSFSVERRKLMRILGAKVILSPAADRGSGMVKKAEEMAKKYGWFLARQFENEANPEYHRNTTGPEILRDFVGKRLDWWVTGYGTGGTLTGAGDILRKARPETKIAVVEPEGAALLAGHEWKPARVRVGRRTSSRRSWTGKASTTRDRDGHRGPRRGARPRGEDLLQHLLGRYLRRRTEGSRAEAGKGSAILAMLPDTGERYLSTILFEGINEGTDPEP